MGLFFGNDEITVDKTIKDIKASDYSYKQKLENYDFSDYIRRFDDEIILSKVLKALARQGWDISVHMDFVTLIYESICINKNIPEEKTIYERFVNLYVKNPEIFIKNNNFKKVISSFNDKEIALEYFNFLLTSKNILENSNIDNLSILIDYIVQARQYFVGDREALASAIKLISDFDSALLKYGDQAIVAKLVEKKLAEDRKANGIYDKIDEAVLAEMDAKLDQILGTGQTLDTLVSTADNTVKMMEKKLELIKSKLKEAETSSIAHLQRECGRIISNFTNSYLELMNQQRSTLVDERDIISQEINSEFEKKKAELLTLADNVGKRVTCELARVTNTANSSVRQIESYVENNEVVKKCIQEAKSNDDLMTILSQIVQSSQHLGIAIPIPSESMKVATSEDAIAPQGTVVMQGMVPNVTVRVPVGPERVLDPKVSYFYDKNIPFKERFEELMRRKREDEEKNGTVYHEKFDTIAKFLMLGKVPNLIGPSGSGKTYMVEKQFSKLLGQKVVTNSYIRYEEDIIGYTNAGDGSYVETNFYRCYKYGDIYFIDEFDNGQASATIILNKFSGGNDESYTFPNGITVNRHPNFRMIVSSNTNGTGKSDEYNSRSKLDESTLQRVIPVECDYDPRVEKNILQDYKAWFNFAVSFREAVQRIPASDGSEINNQGAFTTRDAMSIKEYLDDNVFTAEEIMEYELVGTKDQDYLRKIEENMRGANNSRSYMTRDGKDLLEVFSKVCKSKRVKVLGLKHKHA